MAAGFFHFGCFSLYSKQGFYVVYLKNITVAYLLNFQQTKLQPGTVFKKFLNLGLDILIIILFYKKSLISNLLLNECVGCLEENCPSVVEKSQYFPAWLEKVRFVGRLMKVAHFNFAALRKQNIHD